MTRGRGPVSRRGAPDRDVVHRTFGPLPGRAVRAAARRPAGRDEEARAAAKRALTRAENHLELYPDDTRALNLGAAGLVEQGDKERAMQWAERSLAIDGDNPDTLYNLACSYALMDESDRRPHRFGIAA